MSSLEGHLSQTAGEQRAVLGGPLRVVLEKRLGEEDLACLVMSVGMVRKPWVRADEMYLGVVVDGHNRKAAVSVAGAIVSI